MADANYLGQYVGGVNRSDEMRTKNVKAKMYSFSMLNRPNDEMENVLKELESQCEYILYYRMDMGVVGVIQLSRGVYKSTLEREYEDFVWRRVKSDEMLSRIGWIHRNRLNSYEAGVFSRRCVVKEQKSDFVNRRYFYDPESGRVSKLNDDGVIIPIQLEDREPYKMRKWDPELRKFVNAVESDTEIDEPVVR